MKLSLYYPLKPHYVTQKFGETAFLQYYKDNGVNFKGHNGMDLVCHHGDPIYATHDGYAYYEIDGSQGHGVVLISKDKYDLNDGTNSYIKTIYWHMCDSTKEPKYKSPVEGHNGLFIKTGDVLGYTDNTGLSQGDHLHFALKPVAQGEPSNTWYNLQQENGYNGAVNPAPYFNGKYAVDAHEFKFDFDMEVGDESENVRQLQKKLRALGYFTYPVDTGYYGEVTRNAVYKFQLDNVKMGWWAKNIGRGMYCSSLTRLALNSIIINKI